MIMAVDDQGQESQEVVGYKRESLGSNMPGKEQAACDDDTLGALCPASQYKNVDQWAIEDKGEVSKIVSGK